jgi:hypothetical protein
LKPDCTSGALPILRLTQAPQGGRVLIKRSKIQVTNAGACLSAEAPGYVAFYQSRPDFSGADNQIAGSRYGQSPEDYNQCSSQRNELVTEWPLPRSRKNGAQERDAPFVRIQ